MSACGKHTQASVSFQAYKTPCSHVAAEILSTMYPVSSGLGRICKDSAAWAPFSENIVCLIQMKQVIKEKVRLAACWHLISEYFYPVHLFVLCIPSSH